jgi:hypothetical protein
MGGNFKVRCINDGEFSTLYTSGKVYEISDGIFVFDDGEEIDETINCVEDLILYTSAGWELIEDEGENKVEDLRELLKIGYIVEHIDGKLSRVEINDKEELIISGENHWCNVSSLSKELNGYCGDNNATIKEVYGYSAYNNRAHKISIVGVGRNTIWKREEAQVKSPTQLEIESIELEQRKLADRLAKLKENV